MTDNLTDKKTRKNEEEYYCNICDFKCSYLSDFKRHKTTAKHKKLTNTDKKNEKKRATINEFICNCGKIYKHRQSLFTHQRKCKYVKDEITEKEEVHEVSEPTLRNEIKKEVEKEYNMRTEIRTEIENEYKGLLKEALDTMQSQQKQINEMVPLIGNNNNNTINNNFNLQFYLNNDCKDALNLTDFIDSLRVQLEDLEYTTDNGHIKGITNIFRTALCNMEETKRPLHCTDLKREVLYIKDNDEWHKDENKEALSAAVNKVVDKNIENQIEWMDNHPEILTPGSKDSSRYVKMMTESLGKGDETEQHKIMKNIMKEVTINKDKKLEG
jgi:hypothetical protein